MSALEYSCNGEVKMSGAEGAIRAVGAKEWNAISRAILIASLRKASISKASLHLEPLDLWWTKMDELQ